MKPKWLYWNILVLLLGIWALLPSPSLAATGLCPIQRPLRQFDPVIQKVAVLAPGALGLPHEQIGWVITVANGGSAAGTNLTITDVVRDELQIDQITVDRGTFAVNGQTVTVTVPVLNPGEALELRILTTVRRSPADGDLSNVVTLTGAGPEGAVTERAVASLSVPAKLPATGYPRNLPGEGEPSVWAVGLIAFVLVAATAYLVWRRGSHLRWARGGD
jgi:hypothetical protein